MGSALRGHDYVVAQLTMTGNACLPGEYHVLSNHAGTGQSYLGAEQSIFADRGTMSHLREVVDLCAAAYVRLADTGAVDAGVRLHLDCILQNRRAGLCYLLPARAVTRKAETIGADNGSVLQNDIVTERAVLTHDSVRVGKKILSDPHSAIDDDMWQQHRAVADLDVFINDDISADMSPSSESRRVGNDCRGMNARLILRHRVKQVDGSSESKVGIIAAQQGSVSAGEVFANNDG